MPEIRAPDQVGAGRHKTLNTLFPKLRSIIPSDRPYSSALVSWGLTYAETISGLFTGRPGCDSGGLYFGALRRIRDDLRDFGADAPLGRGLGIHAVIDRFQRRRVEEARDAGAMPNIQDGLSEDRGCRDNTNVFRGYRFRGCLD